jgi:hypothetical protein
LGIVFSYVNLFCSYSAALRADVPSIRNDNLNNLDWGSGSSINGMINAVNVILKALNDTTKTGCGEFRPQCFQFVIRT